MSLSQIEKDIFQSYVDCFSLGEGICGYHYIREQGLVLLLSEFSASFINGPLYFEDKGLSLAQLEDKVLSVHQRLVENGKPYLWRFGPHNQQADAIRDILSRLGATASDPMTTAYSELGERLLGSFQFQLPVEFEDVGMDNLDDWFVVFKEAFELSDELLQFFLEFEQKSQRQPNRPYRSYLGRHLGEPVSIVSTVTNETSLGALFNIGSRPSVRGKSFGSQASVYGCKKLYESNKAYVGQLASSMGLQAYTRLGARAGNQYKNMTWSPVS